MKLETLELIVALIILTVSINNISGNHLIKLKEATYNVDENVPRNLEEDGYNSYIVLYFDRSCSYYNGFYNSYRSGISYIINKKYNDKITSTAYLYIYKDAGIEIHFNSPVISMYHFFDTSYDENMKYLLSIDFTNFDSSRVTILWNMFYGCSSLESIHFSSFDTSLVTDMDYMFYGCSSLKSIDLSNRSEESCYSYDNMFYNTNNLRYINLYNFDKNYYYKN